MDPTMNAKNVATTTVGVGIALLGVLWFLQGADLVHMQPILCLADCEPLVGGSVGWMVAGGVGIVAGTLLIRSSVRRTRSR
jgi:hypothetical protein